MRLALGPGLVLLVVHEHGEAGEPELPVGDGVERPLISAAALELVVARTLGVDVEGGGIVGAWFNEHDVEVGVAEAEANPGRLEREEGSEESVDAELGPQVADGAEEGGDA